MMAKPAHALSPGPPMDLANMRAQGVHAPLMAIVLPPINEVIDLHSVHLAMARRHLPIPIMALLLGAAERRQSVLV